MLIYYNAECGKCKEAKQLLETNRCSFEIREYLKNPPSIAELKELVKLLNCPVKDIIRTKEPLFIEQFEGKALSELEWLNILSENPILIERPTIIDGRRAIIGRLPTLVLDLLVAKPKKQVTKFE